MHGLWHVAALTIIISAFIPIGGSIGVFVGAIILSVLKGPDVPPTEDHQ